MINNEFLPEDVLFVGSGFAVVRKRIGEICESPELTTASNSVTQRIRPVLEAYLKSPLPFLEAVNRLDQPVDGGVIIAFDKETFTALTRQFTEGQIRKRYFAIVEKNNKAFAEKSGILEDWLVFDKKSKKSWIVPESEAQRKGAKKAVMEWSVIGEGDRYFFLSVEPKTGRTHQIRAQLSKFGHPIKGDLKYGAKRSEPGGGIRLHSQTVQFMNPENRNTVTVECDITSPDPLWSALLAALNG